MRVGLLRHFPVVEQLPSGWITAAQLQEWRQRYDRSAAIIGPSDLGDIRWARCLSSDLQRAVATAEAVFDGPIEQTALLREPELAQFGTGQLRMPISMWRWMLRIAWISGHRSQRACRDDFRRRVVAIADSLEAGAVDTLVVSHAGMMAYLSGELRRRRFRGPKLRIAKHAVLYLYERRPRQTNRQRDARRQRQR